MTSKDEIKPRRKSSISFKFSNHFKSSKTTTTTTEEKEKRKIKENNDLNNDDNIEKEHIYNHQSNCHGNDDGNKNESNANDRIINNQIGDEDKVNEDSVHSPTRQEQGTLLLDQRQEEMQQNVIGIGATATVDSAASNRGSFKNKKISFRSASQKQR
eukprot:Awhi_evm1s11996